MQSRPHLTSTDRLRLDVAMATNVEMYSWVGESRFDDRDLLDLVNDGAISSGSFGSYLTALFRTDAASFTYNGDLTRDGRTFYEFGFRVPREESRYLYGKGENQVLTGYDGTLLVDPATAELVRLTIRSNRLPLETATLKLETPDEGMGADANHSKSKRIPTIPAGASFVAALTSAIDTTTAAAGDPLQAKLITPVKDGFKVVVPAGSTVSARITRLEHLHTGPATVSLGD